MTNLVRVHELREIKKQVQYQSIYTVHIKYIINSLLLFRIYDEERGNIAHTQPTISNYY